MNTGTVLKIVRCLSDIQVEIFTRSEQSFIVETQMWELKPVTWISSQNPSAPQGREYIIVRDSCFQFSKKNQQVRLEVATNRKEISGVPEAS